MLCIPSFIYKIYFLQFPVVLLLTSSSLSCTTSTPFPLLFKEEKKKKRRKMELSSQPECSHPIWCSFPLDFSDLSVRQEMKLRLFNSKRKLQKQSICKNCHKIRESLSYVLNTTCLCTSTAVQQHFVRCNLAVISCLNTSTGRQD